MQSYPIFKELRFYQGTLSFFLSPSVVLLPFLMTIVIDFCNLMRTENENLMARFNFLRFSLAELKKN